MDSDVSSCEDVCSVMRNYRYEDSRETGTRTCKFTSVTSICRAKTITVQKAQELWMELDGDRHILIHPKRLQEINDTSRWDWACEIRIAECSDPTAITNTISIEVDFFSEDIYWACTVYVKVEGNGKYSECDQFMRQCIDKYETKRDINSPTYLSSFDKCAALKPGLRM